MWEGEWEEVRDVPGAPECFTVYLQETKDCREGVRHKRGNLWMSCISPKAHRGVENPAGSSECNPRRGEHDEGEVGIWHRDKRA